MAFDRDTALRAAEKAVKLGKLDQAIAEYARVVERQPRDVNTANTLGDLYARVGQTDNAVAQYARIGEHFFSEGFLPKAAALFKKILKIRPDDEQALTRLGQISAKQGLLADARSFLSSVAAKRRARGDESGADDALIELAEVDGSDVAARMQAARILAGRGQADVAAARLRDLAIDLLEKERPQDAVDVLRETVHLVPSDRVARKQLIGLLTDLGQASEAEIYLTRDVAADDPAMLLLVAKAELESGRLEEGREDIRRALAHRGAADDVLAFMREVAPRRAEAGFIAAEALADAAIAGRRVAQAVDVLQRFLEAAPAHVPGALRFVELCLDEDVGQMLPKAQAALAEAYIASGHPESARVIAEDLATAEPSDEAARRLLVRAYESCGVPNAAAQADAFLSGEAVGVADAAIAATVAIPDTAVAAPPAVPIESAGAEPLDVAIPDFDVYVYDQPSPPLEPEPIEPVEPGEPNEPDESEDALVARLLAEEAAQEASMTPSKPAAVMPEIDLTSTLDSLDALDAAEAEQAVSPGAAPSAGRSAAGSAVDIHAAEAAFEEAELAAALRQVADAERLYAEAFKSPPFRFRAASGCGRLLAEEGRLAEAIEWLERAGEVPPPSREMGLALMYDLGDALERHGESMRALAIFMELNAEAGDYRGIAARIDRLARAEIGG